jgi:hypothetical protein
MKKLRENLCFPSSHVPICAIPYFDGKHFTTYLPFGINKPFNPIREEYTCFAKSLDSIDLSVPVIITSKPSVT